MRTTADSGPDSLRQPYSTPMRTQMRTSISFNIPDPIRSEPTTGVCTISPATPLPSSRLRSDRGYTQRARTRNTFAVGKTRCCLSSVKGTAPRHGLVLGGRTAAPLWRAGDQPITAADFLHAAIFVRSGNNVVEGISLAPMPPVTARFPSMRGTRGHRRKQFDRWTVPARAMLFRQHSQIANVAIGPLRFRRPGGDCDIIRGNYIGPNAAAPPRGHRDFPAAG